LLRDLGFSLVHDAYLIGRSKKKAPVAR